MNLVNPERYHHLVAEAEAAGFSGWDFSWLDHRMIQEDPPWDYPGLVRERLSEAISLLDLGTGGGELLASLAPLPAETHATEAYPPNQPLARERLEPLGVTVHDGIDGAPLSFDEDTFDLVISRHESYNPLEVHRILKRGGGFITQQVGGLDNLELNQVLEDTLSFPFTDWGLAAALTGLYGAGFEVERAEKAALKSTFLDIGAVVYYLKAIPWQVAGFTPETHAEGLVRIHNIIERQGQFTTTAHRFLIIARKAGPQ
jgi:SAM-dependent methyltransferase